MNKFEPTDFIASIIIIGGFFLLYLGKDGIVGTTITLIAGYYFGKKSHKLSTIYKQEQKNETTKTTDN